MFPEVTQQDAAWDADDLLREAELIAEIHHMVRRHAHPPSGLGSGRDNLLRKAHALFHSLFLETGHPHELSNYLSHCVAITTDRGTEAGFVRMPDVRFSSLYPYYMFLRFQRDGDGDGDVVGEEDGDGDDATLSLAHALGIAGMFHMTHNISVSIMQCMTLYSSWVPHCSPTSNSSNLAF